MTTHRQSLSILLGDGTIPTEVRIFRAGPNDTERGTYHFTANSADRIQRDAETWGNEYSADYEHASLRGAEAPAAAWYALDIRRTPAGPELWAANIRWTARAAERIAAREYRYISPAFEHDAGHEVTSYVNFALTNLPATRGMEPLVAASKPTSGSTSRYAALSYVERAELAQRDPKRFHALREAHYRASGRAPTSPAPSAAGRAGQATTLERLVAEKGWIGLARLAQTDRATFDRIRAQHATARGRG